MVTPVPHRTVLAPLPQVAYSRSELRLAGLTDRQLSGPAWRRIAPRTYAAARTTVTPEVMLAGARLRIPDGAVFAGRTAAWLHGLDALFCDPIEVVVPEECGVSARAGLLVRRGLLSPDEVVQLRGWPATSIVRTLADLGRHQTLSDGVAAIDTALHSGLVAQEELRAWLGAHARQRGTARLRRALELVEPRSESPMESRLRLVLVLGGLPRPAAQVDLHDRHGEFLARADLYYSEARLVIEYDGGSHRDALVTDNRRQNRLIGAGYSILRFTASDVLGTPDRVVAQVRAALGR